MTEAGWPRAYCAPGCRDLATAALAQRGEDVASIEETAALADDQVIIAAKPPDSGPLLSYPRPAPSPPFHLSLQPMPNVPLPRISTSGLIGSP